LQDKGFISSERKGQTYYYRALVERSEYQKNEANSVLSKLFGGSLKNFVLSVSGCEAVSETDMDELRDLLSQMKEGDADE
jgi:predicted transcriptional regulator